MNGVPLVDLIRHILTFCATCSCPSPGACVDAGSVAGGVASLASLAAAAAAHKFGSPNAGFVYVGGKKATSNVHSGPSSNSPSIGQQPFGSRLVYRDTATDSAGDKWYYVQLPADRAGWLSSHDASDRRPSPPAPSPIHLIDTGPTVQTWGVVGGGAARG